MNLLERIDRGHWPCWPIGGIGSSEVLGVVGQVEGTHTVNLIAIGILGIGTSCVGLWRFFEVQSSRVREERELAKIRVDEARRASLARVPEIIIVTPSMPSQPSPPAPPAHEEPK